MKADRIKVCWNCKEYIFIFLNNSSSKILEKVFESKHYNHMIQIANIDEIDKKEFRLIE